MVFSTNCTKFSDPFGFSNSYIHVCHCFFVFLSIFLFLSLLLQLISSIVEAMPITVAELDNILHNDPAHRACQLEYKQLKDEFENYKRENSNSKTKFKVEEPTDSEELRIAKQKSANLEKELNDLRAWFDEKEKDYVETISNLQCDVTALEEKHSLEVEKLKESCRADVLMLEAQISKQRDRTLQLMADKDAEITRLKVDPIASPVGKRSFSSNDLLDRSPVATGNAEAISKRSFETETAVNQLLIRQNSVCILVQSFTIPFSCALSMKGILIPSMS